MRRHAWHHDKTLNNPVTYLRGPRFLVAWNIHVSCNLSCAMRGIVTREIATRGTHNSHTWNTCGHKRVVNIRYSRAINLQKHVEFSPQL